ncbi:MAG: DUF6198 family protein [Corynebacterium sp.]|nr:DUF6198 family protein [Corynebacterium sp.]
MNYSGPRDLARRYFLLFFGLALMSLGIALSIRSDLGTTPISSVPATLNLITGWTVGTWLILLNLFFVGLQILLLRRRFPPIQLLQIPVVLVFGLFNDAALWLVRDVEPGNYLQQWGLVAAGILVVGVGVAYQVKAKATPLAGEGLILTISNELIRAFGPKKPFLFGNVKVTFDTTLVVIAAVLGLIFLGNLGGVREGTVAAALLVGVVAQATLRLISPKKTPDNAETQVRDQKDPE